MPDTPLRTMRLLCKSRQRVYQTMATNDTRTSRPETNNSLQMLVISSWMYAPWGQDSVGILTPNFHRCSKSEIIGHKNRWIWSGFCSLGPGRILVHIRFEVRYLSIG
jgi:hypothetical protein